MYNQEYIYYEDEYTEGEYTYSYFWDLAASFSSIDSVVSGHDHSLNVVVANGDVYRIDFEVQYESEEGDD